MKQHMMTHKFRDNDPSSYKVSSPASSIHSDGMVPPTLHTEGGRVTSSLHVTTTSIGSKSPGSSPLTSPPSSESVSPPTFTASSGVKRPQEDVGVSMVDRPPEKRAIGTDGRADPLV